MAHTFDIGDRVILGEHDGDADVSRSPNFKYWSNGMRNFVGMEATIVADGTSIAKYLFGENWLNVTRGGNLYMVDIDNGAHYWRSVNMTPLVPIISPDQVCSSCNLPAPHTKSNTSDGKYMCVSCTVLKELHAS